MTSQLSVTQEKKYDTTETRIENRSVIRERGSLSFYFSSRENGLKKVLSEGYPKPESDIAEIYQA